MSSVRIASCIVILSIAELLFRVASLASDLMCEKGLGDIGSEAGREVITVIGV